MKKILELNTIYELSNFIDIDGEPYTKNSDIHYAIISAAYKYYDKRFKVFNITSTGFDLKFYDGINIYNIKYDKYCFIDGIFYERDEYERRVFLRKDKLKKLENKSKRQKIKN
jgi:hypothetical protein